MKFEELDHKLINGFHDAAIRSINVDFMNRLLTLDMDILIGTPDSSTPDEYRAGTLRLSPLYLFYIEPPGAKYQFVPSGNHIFVEYDSIQEGQSDQMDQLLPLLPSNATLCRYFIEKWNSFIYMVGGDVEFSWDYGEAFE